MGGTAYIEFRLNGEHYDAYAGGTAGDEVRGCVGEVSALGGWRARIAFVLDEFPPTHEEVDLDAVAVTGARMPETELLRLAWSSEAAQSAVQLLLELDDDELLVLCRAGALEDARCITVWQELDECFTSDEEKMLSLIRKHMSHEEFSWDPVLNELETIRNAEEAACNAADQVREKALEPFMNRIERLTGAFGRYAASRLDNVRMNLYNNRMVAFRRLLITHVLENGSLPAGVHPLRTQTQTTIEMIDVDLDGIGRLADSLDA
jgi:hypothetical protein